MSIFDKRKDVQEKKFVVDEEIRFKAEARTNKLLALWAAQQMGLPEQDALLYAMDMVEASVANRNGWDAAARVHADLEKKGFRQSEADVRAERERLYEVAIEQIKDGI
jgi:hypothetical protein